MSGTSTQKTQGQSTDQAVAESNVNQIAYQNGAIQKKIYGDQVGSGQSIQLLIHLINREQIQNEELGVSSQMIRAENNLTLNECSILLQERLKIALNNVKIQRQIQGEALNNNISLAEALSLKKQEQQNENPSELYLFYQPTKAIIKQKKKDKKYETLNKYAFIDDKNKVKVHIDLPGIGELPQDKIESRFLQRSIQLKIHDYKNKNWIFAVPKTQCQIRVKQSKLIIKPNKITIVIGKMADADNWHSLHKVKAIGEKDD